MSKILNRIKRAATSPGVAKNYVVGNLTKALATPEFIGAEANRSDSDSGLYVRFVERANRSPKIFARFKQHPHYQEVLEGVQITREQGKEYLDIVAAEAPDLRAAIEKFKINDLIGSPMRFEYDGIGLMSPTTLRYVKVASDIRRLFGDLNGKKIVEIGVGHGGQCLVLDQIYRFHQYHLYDLPPVLTLTSKYLECHVMNSSYRTSTLNQCDGADNYDLAISNYAFSELPAHIEAKYIEKILSRSQRGYLTMNSGKATNARPQNKLTLAQLRDLLPPFEILEEKPVTGPDNFIIVWGHR